jgi:hypothetical protein
MNALKAWFHPRSSRNGPVAITALSAGRGLKARKKAAQAAMLHRPTSLLTNGKLGWQTARPSTIDPVPQLSLLAHFVPTTTYQETLSTTSQTQPMLNPNTCSLIRKTQMLMKSGLRSTLNFSAMKEHTFLNWRCAKTKHFYSTTNGFAMVM